MKEMTMKEKIDEAFDENDRAHKELTVALDEWKTVWVRGCKLIAKRLGG